MSNGNFRVSLGSNFRDRTGETLGGVLIVRRAASITRRVRWLVRCVEGHEFVVTAECISSAVRCETNVRCVACMEASAGKQEARCPSCEKTKPLDDKHFYRSNTQKSGFQTYCKQCDSSSRRKTSRIGNRAGVANVVAGSGDGRGYQRPRPKHKVCLECYDLPDRRPPEGCRCGKARAIERPETIEQRTALMRAPERVVVF